MAKIWKNRIVAKTKTFSECPIRYKDAVKALLQELVETKELTQEEVDALLEM